MTQLREILSRPDFNPTDAIYLSPDLTAQDRDLAKRIFQINLDKHNKQKSKFALFHEVQDKEFTDMMDFKIKAVLQHLINQRLGGT